MPYPGLGMPLQPLFFVRASCQFPFQTSHASYHGVEVLEHLIWRRRVGEAGICGIFEALSDGSAVSLHRELGDLKILPQQLVGKT